MRRVVGLFVKGQYFPHISLWFSLTSQLCGEATLK